MKRFGLDIYKFKTDTLSNDLFGEAISLSLNGTETVRMGAVNSHIVKMFGLKQEVFFAEIDFDRLVRTTKKHKITVEDLSKFPEVRRDLALLVDKAVTFSQLREIAFATEKKLLKNVALFDVYEGDKLPEGKKSYALSFILEDKTQTLNDKAIERVMANLQKQFEVKTGAQIR